MAEFTVNDVLLKHNDDVLSYAVESVGNHRFQVYLDLYRSDFQDAEERKDIKTCCNIVTDIVNTICSKSVPNGRFLEFDAKKNIWYNVGTGAIPCQRTRTGLLGLLSNSTSNEYHADKSIVEMSKTMRARTMKALHYNENKLRAVINLNDDRFKMKEQVLINDQAHTSTIENKGCSKRSTEEKIIFADSVKKCLVKDETASKKRKYAQPEAQSMDIICGGIGEGILQTDTPGNRLFHSLVNARLKNYNVSDDNQKFKEVCKDIRFMQQICPSCQFLQRKENSKEWTELSWQDTMEKTIQSFCNPFNEYLSDIEIENFITENPELYDNYFCELPNDAHDTMLYDHDDLNEIKVEFPVYLAVITDECTSYSNKSVLNEAYVIEENVHLCCNQEQEDFLDVFFPVEEKCL